MAISGGTAAERTRVRDLIRGAARRAGRSVTDRRLRRCIIGKLAGGGDIVVEACEDPDLLGWNAWTVFFGFKLSASSTIHVCVGNHGADDVLLEETLVHEFAHACCWDHGDGKGVPD